MMKPYEFTDYPHEIYGEILDSVETQKYLYYVTRTRVSKDLSIWWSFGTRTTKNEPMQKVGYMVAHLRFDRGHENFRILVKKRRPLAQRCYNVRVLTQEVHPLYPEFLGTNDLNPYEYEKAVCQALAIFEETLLAWEMATVLITEKSL